MYSGYPLMNSIRHILESETYNSSSLTSVDDLSHLIKIKNLSSNLLDRITDGEIFLFDFSEMNLNEIRYYLESVAGECLVHKNPNGHEIIESKPNPKWYFETNLCQAVHTDDAHEIISPNIISLFFSKVSDLGGDTILVDSETIFKFIKMKHPECYTKLFEECISIYSNKKVIKKRVFSMDGDRVSISFTPLLNKFECDKDIHIMLQDINELIHCKALQKRIKLNDGQCIIFSNSLYLHSRTKFEEGSGRKVYRFWF